ncbi:hypothetical protein Q5752_003033 [Cryptotrichosporon argae]
MDQPSAGPSRPRKPRGPHPSQSAPSRTRTRLRPPLPPAPPQTGPTLPIKTVQGLGTRRTDTTRPGFGREIVFVTRKVGLGALMARAKSLVMDEGYTHITLHALSAAIPHALLLLHTLLDILPYPVGERGMWYEIRTGSVECVDEVGARGGGKAWGGSEAKKADGDAAEGAGDEDEFAGIGAVEASAPVIQKRIKSSIEIHLHISATRKAVVVQTAAKPKRKREGDKARPSKKRRRALAAARREGGAGNADAEADDDEEDEEDAMNA